MPRWRKDLKLLANHLPQRLFQCGPPLALDEGAERAIDQRLVVTTASAVHCVVEVLQNVLVQANGDAFLARRYRQHPAAFALTEVVSLFHRSASWSLRSPGVA